MSTALLATLNNPTTDGGEVPQTQEQVRSTVEPVRQDQGETVGIDHAPDWNEQDSDSSGQLVGLAPRETIGHVVPGQRYTPWWATEATVNHNRLIDEQVATSGTAARREDAGQQGHGSMSRTESLEPVIRPGAAYGSAYFESNDMPVQQGAGAYMSPDGTNQDWATQVIAARARAHSRDAYRATRFENLFKDA